MTDGKSYFLITDDYNTNKSEKNLNLTNSKEDKTNTEKIKKKLHFPQLFLGQNALRKQLNKKMRKTENWSHDKTFLHHLFLFCFVLCFVSKLFDALVHPFRLYFYNIFECYKQICHNSLILEEYYTMEKATRQTDNEF